MTAATGDGREERGRPGRPRSTKAMNSVLHHAEKILEQDGYRALTVEAVAARSGVSKTTIYRWWPDRAAVAMDALLSAFEADIHEPDTGDVVGDLEAQVAEVIDLLGSTPRGPALAGLISAAQTNPDLAEALRDRFLARRRAVVIGLIERGGQRGQLAPGFDSELVADLLYGPVYYRLMIGHEPLDRDFGTTLLNQLCAGLEPHDAAAADASAPKRASAQKRGSDVR